MFQLAMYMLVGRGAMFSNTGTVLSEANGFSGGGLNEPFAIALDGQGNAWVSDRASKSVIKLDNNGGILSGASGFQTGSPGSPDGVAIDTAGNAWVGNDDYTVTEFSNNGTLLLGGTGGSNTSGVLAESRVCDRREWQCVVELPDERQVF